LLREDFEGMKRAMPVLVRMRLTDWGGEGGQQALWNYSGLTMDMIVCPWREYSGGVARLLLSGYKDIVKAGGGISKPVG